MIRTFAEHDVRVAESLDGMWDFVTAPERKDRTRLPRHYTRKLHVPAAWEQTPGLEHYRGKAWYRKFIGAVEGMAVRLVFGGVSHTATIYVDGARMGHHEDAFTPFDVIVPGLTPGAHELVVEVDNSFGDHAALHLPNDYFTYGGITRPAELQFVPEVYIARLRATPHRQGQRWALDLAVVLENWGTERASRGLVVRVGEASVNFGHVSIGPEATRTCKVTLDELKEHIRNSVLLRCLFQKMRMANQCQADDEFDRMYKRYAGVFEHYNPWYEQIEGFSSTNNALRKAAGVGVVETAEQEHEKIHALLQRDEFFLDNMSYRWTTSAASLSLNEPALSASGGPVDQEIEEQLREREPRRPSPADICRQMNQPVPELSRSQKKYLSGVRELNKTSANSSPCWKALEALKKFIHAVRSGWFDVDGLIHAPATRLFPDAVLATLHDLVAEDKVEFMASMLNRTDRLYGDVDLDTVVFEKKQFTCIDLAAHYGSIKCLEWLLAHQRYRVDEAGPSRLPLATIATIAKQPLALVALDNFCDINLLSVGDHKNFINYGILQSGPKEQTVLHLCVEKCRSDLLRYCADRVQYHLETPNKEGAVGQTPLQLAEYVLTTASYLSAEERKEVDLCKRHLKQMLEGLDGTDSASQSAAAPPPSAALVPARNRDSGESDDEGDDSDEPPPALPTVEEMQLNLAMLSRAPSPEQAEPGNTSSRRRKRHGSHKEAGDEKLHESGKKKKTGSSHGRKKKSRDKTEGST